MEPATATALIVLGLSTVAWIFGGVSWKPEVAAQIPGMTPEKVFIAGEMVAQWKHDDWLTKDEMAALLSIAYNEGLFKLNAVSAAGMPDDAGGRSWGTFQFLQKTIDSLGIDKASLSPRRNADGSLSTEEIARASRASARAAEKFLAYRPRWVREGGYPSFLEGVRAGPHPLLDIYVAWQAGHSRRWADIAKIAPSNVPGSLGYVHPAVKKRASRYRDFLKAL